MGSRGTAVLFALVILAAAFLWLEESRAPRPADDGDSPPSGAATVAAMRRLLVFNPADVVSLQLERADQAHRVELRNGTWVGIDDASAVSDFLRTLAKLPVLMDIAPPGTDPADFGLAPPLGVIVLTTGAAQPLVLQIGSRNPATTGVYVRNGENGPVVLAGALVEWEFDNLFKRLAGRPG